MERADTERADTEPVPGASRIRDQGAIPLSPNQGWDRTKVKG